MTNTISINFRGGIISPGDLYNIMLAASKVKVMYVRFGLRQQLLIDMESYSVDDFTVELDTLQIAYEINSSNYPNICSSYPAEEVFINNTWLSEGVYKDIFDSIDYTPKLKINICDSNQSFTPILTGNINWIASTTAQHYWYLIVRFPKTNVIYEWGSLCYTNDIPAVTKRIEEIILQHPEKFMGNETANGEELFAQVNKDNYSTKQAENPVTLPAFNLPYYEGLNRYNNNKYWLGIYRRDELFSVLFLKKLCKLCLETKLGQLCCTSWKTIIIKSIEEKDKAKWNLLLEEFQINMRHAANELNFQVEDNSAEGLALKTFLVNHLSMDDTRTFGICIGIKTRKKSEIFSSILVRRRYVIDILGIKLFKVYDILCAKDFNPNERTGEIFSKDNPKVLLPEQLRRCILKFYEHRADLTKSTLAAAKPKPAADVKKTVAYVYQCSNCFSVYDEVAGDAANGIAAGILFEQLPAAYCCPLCEADKNSFKKIEKTALGL
ncbi:rubredoxin [Ferruginibacter sp.]|nr:rubredoxin [Ferruginibacter sp.]